jgi:hypothetical protein
MPDVSDALSQNSTNFVEPLPLVRGGNPTPVNNRPARAFATIAIAAVALVQIWIISAGRMIDWPTSTNYYSLLADAFLHGQTSLRDGPSPQLLALPDPYDPSQNENFRLHDMSLYRGRYFLYWGPVPAILECPFVLLFHRAIGDQYLVFCFVLGIALISAEILLDLRKLLFPDAAPWTVAMGILVAGLATPMPILLERPAVYEAAIAAGQFFLLSGIYFVIRAFASGGSRPSPLILAGTCWALAIGSRASLAVAIAALTILVAWRLCRNSPQAGRIRFRITTSCLMAMGAPLLLAAVLLGSYNYVRFGNWHEFGQQYQLAGFNLRKIQDHIFTSANVPPAIYAYLIHPLLISTTFPFVRATGIGSSLPLFIKLPPDYEASAAVAGVLWCVPFVCFAAITLLFLGRQLFKARTARARRQLDDAAEPREILWIALCFSMASLLGLLPVLFLIGCSIRYLADFTPALIILAMLGLWIAVAEKPKSHRRLSVQASILALYSIVVGILLGSAIIAIQLGF